MIFHYSRIAKSSYCCVLYCLVLLSSAANAAVEQFSDPNSGLLSWKSTDNGFSLQLIQLLPDYVTAVYSARGLPKELIDGVLMLIAEETE